MMQRTHGQPAAEIAHLERDWAVILAGGDGTRLKSLTRRIAGDDRPKQFCSVLGGATLLEETQRRAALEVPKERTLFLVNQAHERYYAPLLWPIPIPPILSLNRVISGRRRRFFTVCCAWRLWIRKPSSLFFHPIITFPIIEGSCATSVLRSMPLMHCLKP